MAVFIVALVCGILCAFPFLVMAIFLADNTNMPIPFLASDYKLKISNLKDYNKCMAVLYKKVAVAFLITPFTALLSAELCVVCVVFCCTGGWYIVYRKYKKILEKYR